MVRVWFHPCALQGCLSDRVACESVLLCAQDVTRCVSQFSGVSRFRGFGFAFQAEPRHQR